MEPFASEVGLSALNTVHRQVARLIDAVRGAKDAKSTWYSLCKELGDHSGNIQPLLAALEAEIRRGSLPRSTMETTEDVIAVLTTALEDGIKLVLECQGSNAVTLFMRGTELKKRFKGVADSISRCLSSIPLVALGSNLATQRLVQETAERLRKARCVVSHCLGDTERPVLTLYCDEY